MGHYDVLENTAVHAFRLIGPPHPPNVIADCLSMQLVAQLKPEERSTSPFLLTDLKVEPADSVEHRHQATGVVLEPDPCPGSSDSVVAAQASRTRLMRVHIYCQPVAVELLIPGPSARDLTQLRYDPDWERRLELVLNPLPTFRWKEMQSDVFVTPLKAGRNFADTV